MPSHGGQKALDFVSQWATPTLEAAGKALRFSPIPGLSLVAEGLSVIVDRVKVSLRACF